MAVALLSTGLMMAGFLMGRLSALSSPLPPAATPPALRALPVQAQGDPREMIPLPGPGNQQPGQQPGQGQGECPVLIYQDGQLYSFPGPGFGPGPGFPGGDPELIPLQPGLPSPLPPTPAEPAPTPQNPSI
ncbi:MULTISPECIES: hypothetical protein [unclassified Meiothermus]|uniref:hypothetical protein n=1 Tax=unclassified Meiothermus TaxID=370471 RepID=UPI001021E149|nr:MULTISPECIES: hypothetical protein [unclassified Meiothermus]RYM40011.1 hypothetical protein EWH23_02245 [Meiothermus sp. PNK-Is4]